MFRKATRLHGPFRYGTMVPLIGTPKPTRNPMHTLEINGLTKSFRTPDGEVLPVVAVGEYTLAEGEQAALVGGSGSGKTTFLHLVAGILRADAGTVSVAGMNLASLGDAARDRVRATTIGYVFQTFNLLQGYTALENVVLGMSFGPGPDHARAEELLARVGMADRLRYRPRQLSVGQQQRVAVARALAHRPALVLADEPTGNLDARSAGAALDLLREVCTENNAALLVVSHDPGLLERFDRVDDFAAINQPAGAPA